VIHVRTSVIVYKYRPVNQWMIIKMGYNVWAKRIVAVCNVTEVTLLDM
jgi:hypothetical protein